jgi:hypothetical protein
MILKLQVMQSYSNRHKRTKIRRKKMLMIAGHLMQRIVNTLSFDPHPNRTQMDSYIRYTRTRCWIFVHSMPENPETWEECPSKK